MTDVEVIGNRFFKAETGFSFAKPPDGKLMKVQLANNTVSEAKDGGVFFDYSPGAEGEAEIVVARNFFVRTPNAIRSSGPGGAVAGVTFLDNGFGKDAQPGNIPEAIKPVEGPPQPSQDQSDDATFLQFPGNGGPSVGGKKIGARRNLITASTSPRP